MRNAQKGTTEKHGRSSIQGGLRRRDAMIIANGFRRSSKGSPALTFFSVASCPVGRIHAKIKVESPAVPIETDEAIIMHGPFAKR